MSMPISPRARVTLHFSLSLADGQLIDSTFDRAPAQYVPGDGNFLPAFESVLNGLQTGDRQQFHIAAEDAFGERKDANLRRVPRSRFSSDIELVPGLVMSFSVSEGGELPGVVHRLMGDMVEIDFNHPLAGRDLLFEVQILAVEPVEIT